MKKRSKKPAEKAAKTEKKPADSTPKKGTRKPRRKAAAADKTPAVKKAKRARRPKRASKKAAAVDALKQKRLAAGRKAAETRRANATPRRGPGRPPKDSSQPRDPQERAFMDVAIDVGIARSERILQQMREVAQKVA